MGRALMVVAFVVVGCRPPHVQLQPPRPDLTAADRVAMFEARAARAEKTTWTRTCGNGGCSTTIEKTLYLADGTQVSYPEDLLPVLPPDSESARHVHASLVARQHVHWWTGGSLVAAAVGAVAFGVQMNDTNPSMVVPMGALVVAGVAGIGAWHYRNAEADETGLAYETYTKGLAERLAICSNGLAVVACENNVPGAPSPPPASAPAPDDVVRKLRPAPTR